MKSFNEYFSTSQLEINQFLDNYFEKWLFSSKSVNKKLEALIGKFIESCHGGKRLRGILVKLGCNLTGKESNNIIFLASAFELFQTAILAHDDIIDQSPLRRGRPSLYNALGNNHYGISQGICLGDVGLFLSNKIITESPIDAKKKAEIFTSFVETQYQTSLGELLDIELSYSDDYNMNDILTVYINKTSYYTIIGPLQLGAIMGDADFNLLNKIKEYGKDLGIAFQIKDDILDIFGEKETTGKANTSDIEEGKITLLWYFVQEKATESQKKILKNIYGKKGITMHDIEQLRQIIFETKALDRSNSFINKHSDMAREIILEMDITCEYKNILNDLCDYMITRDK
jgi:geranylgeranyl pyrophosphate synthase